MKLKTIVEQIFLEKINPSVIKSGFKKEEHKDGWRLVVVGAFLGKGGYDGSDGFTMFVFDPKTDTQVAKADFMVVDQDNFERSRDKLEIPHMICIGVFVKPEFRRKGIATIMYNFAKELGNDIGASMDQSDDAKAFWDSRNK